MRFRIHRQSQNYQPGAVAAKGQAWRGISNAAASLGGQAVKAEQEMNRADAEDAMAMLDAHLDTSLYDPEKGYFNTHKGDKAEGLTRNLFGVDGQGGGSTDYLVMEYGKGLQGKSREMFEAMANHRLKGVKQQTRVFEANERRNYLKATQEMGINDAYNRIGVMYDRPHEIQSAISRGMAVIDGNAVGLDEASLVLAKQEFVSDAHASVITSWLSRMQGGNAEEAAEAYSQAKSWYDGHKDQMSGTEHAVWEKKLGQAWEYKERRLLDAAEDREKEIEEEEKRVQNSTAKTAWKRFATNNLTTADVLDMQGNLDKGEFKALIKATKPDDGPARTDPNTLIELMDMQDDAWTEDEHQGVYREARRAYLQGRLSQADFRRFRKENIDDPLAQANKEFTRQEKAKQRLIKETRSMYRKALRTSISLSDNPFFPKSEEDAKAEAETMLMYDQLTRDLDDDAEIQRIHDQVLRTHKLKFFRSGHLATLEKNDPAVVARIEQLNADRELLVMAWQTKEIDKLVAAKRLKPIVEELKELGGL